MRHPDQSPSSPYQPLDCTPYSFVPIHWACLQWVELRLIWYCHSVRLGNPTMNTSLTYAQCDGMDSMIDLHSVYRYIIGIGYCLECIPTSGIWIPPDLVGVSYIITYLIYEGGNQTTHNLLVCLLTRLTQKTHHQKHHSHRQG